MFNDGNTPNATVNTPKQKMKNMLRNIGPSRYIAYRLFMKDIKSKLAKAKFGLIWDFVDPLSMAGVFIALYYMGIIKGGKTEVSYPTYVTFGMLLYQTYSEAITLSLNTISRHKTLITQQPVTPEALIIGNVYSFLFYGVIRCVIMLVVAILQGDFSLLGFPFFVVLYPSIIISGMSLGTLLAPFDVLFNDVGRGVRILLNIMRFATPVMWVFPHDRFGWLYTINPVASILDSLRTLATQGMIPYWHESVLWFAGSCLILLVGWYFFHVAVLLLAEQA